MSYGCYNRPGFNQFVVVQRGWIEDGTHGHLSRRPDMAVVPFRMTESCQYTLSDLGQVDSQCIGCRHRVDPAGG